MKKENLADKTTPQEAPGNLALLGQPSLCHAGAPTFVDQSRNIQDEWWVLDGTEVALWVSPYNTGEPYAEDGYRVGYVFAPQWPYAGSPRFVTGYTDGSVGGGWVSYGNTEPQIDQDYDYWVWNWNGSIWYQIYRSSPWQLLESKQGGAAFQLKFGEYGLETYDVYRNWGWPPKAIDFKYAWLQTLSGNFNFPGQLGDNKQVQPPGEPNPYRMEWANYGFGFSGAKISRWWW